MCYIIPYLILHRCLWGRYKLISTGEKIKGFEKLSHTGSKYQCHKLNPLNLSPEVRSLKYELVFIFLFWYQICVLNQAAEWIFIINISKMADLTKILYPNFQILKGKLLLGLLGQIARGVYILETFLFQIFSNYG